MGNWHTINDFDDHFTNKRIFLPTRGYRDLPHACQACFASIGLMSAHTQSSTSACKISVSALCKALDAMSISAPSSKSCTPETSSRHVGCARVRLQTLKNLLSTCGFVEIPKPEDSLLARRLEVGGRPPSVHALMEASSALRRLAILVVVVKTASRSLGRCREQCASANRGRADAHAERSEDLRTLSGPHLN